MEPARLIIASVDKEVTLSEVERAALGETGRHRGRARLRHRGGGRCGGSMGMALGGQSAPPQAAELVAWAEHARRAEDQKYRYPGNEFTERPRCRIMGRQIWPQPTRSDDLSPTPDLAG
jgi:hypothetical protein